MQCVVAAKPKLDGEQSGSLNQWSVHADQSRPSLESREIVEREPQVLVSDSSRAVSPCQGRLAFSDREDAGRNDSDGGAPELNGQIRFRFGDDQLDESRRVEVEVQFRCSETSSETGPVAAILGW